MITMFRGPASVSPSSGSEPSIGLNVFVLPAAYAHAFLAFCYGNYSSGSVVDFTKEGDPTLLAGIGPIDVRTAAASYDLMEGNRLVERVRSLTSSWRDDLVAIGIGCSVALDEVLKSNGVVPKHARLGKKVAVYRTGRPTRHVGPFRADLHVSMRVVNRDELDQVTELSARYPALHGAPIHVGDARALGIENLNEPVLGDVVQPGPDEVCAFWGCGVTLRSSLSQSGLPWTANTEGSLAATALKRGDFEAGYISTSSRRNGAP